MSARNAGSVVLIMGGVVLAYLAVTGYAGGVWSALKGPKSVAPATGQAGGVSRALGRGGTGGMVDNLPVATSGYFTQTTTGGLSVTGQGRW